MKPLLVVAALFLLVPTASGKDIPFAALLVCGATQCRTVTDPADAQAFRILLWGDDRVARAPTPRVGSPVFQLRFKDRPAGVILNATAFRVHGLDCGRFRRGVWYRLPPRLRGLTTGLKPKRLRASVPRSC